MDRINTTCALTCLLAAGQVSAANTITGAESAVVAGWVWVCVITACVVFAAILYSVIAFRPGVDSGTDARHRNAARESMWAAVPIAIVIAAAAPAMTHLPFAAPAQIDGELQACTEARSCRAQSIGQLAAHGIERCTAPIAGNGESQVAALPHIATPCSARR